MSKAVNILEVLEKAHQSSASVSKRNKQAIIDAYGRALTMKKVLDDFIKVNRNLITDMGTILHGKDYTCLLYTSPSPRDATLSRMPSSA